MSEPAEKTENSGASRIAPRSARAALEPERIAQPLRRSRRARHPIVVVGNAILTLLVLVAIVGGLALAIGKQRFEAPGPLDRERIVNIPRGLGIKDIADVLQREGVIDQPWVFMGGVIALKARDELKYGEYLFHRQASLRDVVDTLVEGKVIQHHVTVPEGLTSEQIVARLLENDILGGSLKEIPKEGTLLPETYRFTRGTTREQIIQRMQQAHRRAVQDAWERRASDLPLQNPEQLVVLASIIEKETGRADERSRVAAVFVNRLKQKMKLQSDPTIIYGLVGGKGTLGRPIMRSEIEQPTPYNTYVITGLPPGPVANPGRAALEAAANPSRTREIYFVADGSGGHAFSETFDQHQRNVARLRQWEQQQKDRTPPDATVAPSPAANAYAPATPPAGTPSSPPSTAAQSPRAPAQAAPAPAQAAPAPAPRPRPRAQDAPRQ
ncbi:MAG: endolytic transglycosylase MltG [Xanthobacteraceae bacterium]